MLSHKSFLHCNDMDCWPNDWYVGTMLTLPSDQDLCMGDKDNMCC